MRYTNLLLTLTLTLTLTICVSAVIVELRYLYTSCLFVAVTSINDLWSLDKDGRLHRCDVCVLPCQSPSPSPKSAVSVVENDWQLV